MTVDNDDLGSAAVLGARVRGCTGVARLPAGKVPNPHGRGCCEWNAECLHLLIMEVADKKVL